MILAWIFKHLIRKCRYRISENNAIMLCIKLAAMSVVKQENAA